MNKLFKKIGVLCIVTAILATSVTATSAYAAENGYTYNYDYWGDVQYSPDAYSVGGVFTSAELGLDIKMNAPQSLFVKGNRVYVCDTGNNRILELERTNTTEFSLVRIIDKFYGDIENTTFSAPTDIAVSEDGCFFIADKNNKRILKLDEDLNYIMEFTKPTDETFNQGSDFLPSKITIDTAGRVYCVASNVNKGLIKYEADGAFAGFIGATPVTYNWTDYLWKRIATKEQRERMESFVPTEYDNLFMDHEGFIYVCTTHVSEAELDNGTADPIRRLNMMGNDILIRNGNWYIIGDIYWGSGGGYSGPSLMTDVTVFDNDTYFCLDKTRGRIFGYDDQGRLLYAFGGRGNIDGYFKLPSSIEHMGYDLLVLDQTDGSLTLFIPTEFGKLIFQAIEQFQGGQYEASGESWQEVIKLNGNYDLAYIGVGRSLLRQEKYREAMDYFRLKWDADNYSKAFRQYRKQWAEEHIMMIIAAVVIFVCLPLLIGKIKKVKHEIDTDEYFKRNPLK